MTQQWKLMMLGALVVAGVAQAAAQDWAISIGFGSQNGGVALSYSSVAPVYAVPRPVLVHPAPAVVCVPRERFQVHRVIYVAPSVCSSRSCHGHVTRGPVIPCQSTPARLRYHPHVEVAYLHR